MVNETQHPGAYVREHVIPTGMNVTKAANLIEVSRSTLSNFLNGNADLSPEMAARLSTAFGVSARELLDRQSAWDAAQTKRGTAAPIKAYVPPFLQIKAARIGEWATSGIAARQRLSVFLRTLVNSTGVNLSKVDFPGNDESEQPGWDGEIVAEQATPWIPAEHSGWEFGVTSNSKGKADHDFKKSVAGIDETTRKKMTFVFVTPHDWSGKAAWIKDQKAKKLWKDVRVYDAGDLEQWLEQSLAAQAWFASETGQDTKGAISLDEAWKVWSADCEPALTRAMFADAVRSAEATLRRGLTEMPYRPIVITADSKDEALAFLSVAFWSDSEEFGTYRDRMIVFREPGSLSKLASQVSNFIPVIPSREVEKEFAPFSASMPSFIIYPRNALAEDPDIELETLNWQSFDAAMQDMGVEHDRIDKLSRESGRSPTVLRRRLSKLPAVNRPDWSSNTELARSLIPFLFAGTWKLDNKTDQAMLELLAGDVPFGELERRLAALLPIDSAPVWSVGSLRGVVSKIDVLFAISEAITSEDLQRFFAVAEIVLSEDDPSLELPEKDRWAASIYGKTREISGALRSGIGETLVLLSVYGSALFKKRLNFDTAWEASALVMKLLSPLTAKTLESQIDNVGVYAEASPERFLSIIEADLKTADSAAIALMRPKSDSMFGSTPRTGLLWALEGLAWSNELFMRTVLALGELAERPLDDNLVNKPSNSLSAIFRSWMPQTSADLAGRKAALAKLAEVHPKVAWPICLDQFAVHSRFGSPSHKPRWRPDGHGMGNPISGEEPNDFAQFAFHMALKWPSLTCEMVCDLLNNIGGVHDDLQLELWDVIDKWAETASDEDRAALRERIRVTTMTRHAVIQRGRRGEPKTNARAKQAYDRLEPKDPVHRHAWLFKKAWVDESADEIADEELDYRSREERITRLRKDAVREVYTAGGVADLMRLIEGSDAGYALGWSLGAIVEETSTLVATLVEIAEGGEISGARWSAVMGIAAQGAPRSVLAAAAKLVSQDKLIPLLSAAPFDRDTWAIVDSFGAAVTEDYWRKVTPNWNRDAEDVMTGVSNLLKVHRPRAAFRFAHSGMKDLPPRIVYDMMLAVTEDSNEPENTYLLERYDLREAFQLLNDAADIKEDAIASLEFRFIDIFDDEQGRPLNLEREVCRNPELFVQAVAFAFKRSDENEDPPELQVDKAQGANRAHAAYKLLDVIARLPGTGDDGTIDGGDLVRWVEQARAGCIALAREEIGDQMIGKLISHAPAEADGVWPVMPVRDALERVMTEHIERGLHVAMRNSRGVHWRGSGGDQEREIAAKYARWAEAMEYTHPRLAALLRGMEQSYLWDAEREDTDARASRRLIR
ncbi:HigA family addiction module antidote protein [Rhizobium leguminosarum]|uniref:HigA family addiction module antitoxin n=1 Tax=Rhizobium leguminosarum TaxID=384 RepID=UPI001C96D2BF|nr:HigA family addiction module antitoxin [Rhizobium leguminosarum]MBY5762884.1 HigA family addiction module antidote protein [Rhizobium leguminosarum]